MQKRTTAGNTVKVVIVTLDHHLASAVARVDASLAKLIPGFSLALHAWDEPAETLLSLGTKGNAQLMMPRLGEAVEPAHAERVTPWWRAVDSREVAMPPARDAPDASPMTLPKTMPWPID